MPEEELEHVTDYIQCNGLISSLIHIVLLHNKVNYGCNCIYTSLNVRNLFLSLLFNHGIPDDLVSCLRTFPLLVDHLIFVSQGIHA